MGRRAMASQIGRGIRMVSTKQDVGMGEEMLDDGPKPSRRLLQSCIAKVGRCQER